MPFMSTFFREHMAVKQGNTLFLGQYILLRSSKSPSLMRNIGFYIVSLVGQVLLIVSFHTFLSIPSLSLDCE